MEFSQQDAPEGFSNAVNKAAVCIRKIGKIRLLLNRTEEGKKEYGANQNTAIRIVKLKKL